MKHVMLLALGLAVACVACAEPPEVAETGGSIEIKGDAYVAVISKSEGGALASLKSRDGKVAFLSDLRIYTDHGLYVERGYVGTKGESQPQVTLEREGETIAVSSRGVLRGKPAVGQELIPYRIAYTFDRSPRILVECQVTPLATEKEVGAFLAMCFAVPQMREWAANTMDGIVREDVKETAGRSYESSKLPLDAASPLVGFINGDGTSLRVSDIRSEGPAGVQNVIIHGKAFFLAWLSDAPVRVTAVPHRVRFTLSLGHGDPVR